MPLQLAIQNHHYDIVRVLVFAGANINFIAKYDKSMQFIFNGIFLAFLEDQKRLNTFLKNVDNKYISEMLTNPLQDQDSVAASLLSGNDIDLFFSFIKKLDLDINFLRNGFLQKQNQNILINILYNVMTTRNETLIDIIFQECDLYLTEHDETITVENQLRLLSLAAKNPHINCVRQIILSNWIVWEKVPFSEGVQLLADVFPDKLDNMGAKSEALLRMASQYGYINIVKYLLSNKVNVNAFTDDGITSLILAVTFRRKEIISLLIKHGATWDFIKVYDPRKVSCYQNFFLFLLEQWGPYKNWHKFLDDSDSAYFSQILLSYMDIAGLLNKICVATCLSMVARCENRDAIYSHFVKVGAINLAKYNKSYQKMYNNIFFALYSKIEYFEVFVKSVSFDFIPGIMKLLKSSIGCQQYMVDILCYALQCKNIDYANYVFSQCNEHFKMNKLTTENHEFLLSQLNQHPEWIEKFIVCDWINHDIMPLHYAVQHKSLAMIDVLLSRNADINVKSKASKTPFELAKEMNEPDIIKRFNRERLMSYINKTKTRIDNNNIYSHWFNQTCYEWLNYSFFGCSAHDKFRAANALLSVVDENENLSQLAEHQNSLNEGELNGLFLTFYGK